MALIRDREFFDWIERNARNLTTRGMAEVGDLIRRCAELHVRQIATGGDPFELGSSRPLDFGHWLAHKLEQVSEFKLSHGHCVALGMTVDSLYASRIGLLSVEDLERVLGCLSELGFSQKVSRHLGLEGEPLIDHLMTGISEFQEHLGGRLALTLLRGIGIPTEVSEVDAYQMRQVLRKLF